MPTPVAQRRVTTFAKNLLGGGAEGIAVNLLRRLPRETFAQDLVPVSVWRPFSDQLPDDVALTDIGRGGSVARAVIPLAHHIRTPPTRRAHLSVGQH